jgi:transglutaminase-like putative cysteine protease
MRRVLLIFLFVSSFSFGWASSVCAVEQRFVLPHDGMFYIEARPVSAFKATLSENWVNPGVGEGTLNVFVPVLPELPGQMRVSTRLLVEGNVKLKAEEIVEEGVDKRAMLRLRIDSNEMSPKSGIPLRLEYTGVLYARTLRRGRAIRAVPELTGDERRQYLAASATMDYNDPEFLRWLDEQGLKRRGDEDTMQFAHRVFTSFIEKGSYGGDTSSYEARRPSRVCKSLTNDCGGLALLFVAVMRSNNVPARTLFGRWAIPQTDEYGQYHVMAEFFVDKSGWVPVDISGTIVHKPKDPNAFFGTTDGRFIAFHIDTDLEPAKGFRHAWAQYMLLQWSGQGNFWKEHHLDSKWDVQCRKLTAQ